jgi:FAD/FMN-containing dehydrogenase
MFRWVACFAVSEGAASILSAFPEIAMERSATVATCKAVVAPRTVDEAAQVIRHAREAGLSVLPIGSGSTMREPHADVALSTSSMAGVIDYQPDDLTIVVGAGMSIRELDAVLSDRGHSAVLPESSPERTVGGVVASGASGYARLRYGPTRDRVLEVTMATGYGDIVRAGGRLVKNVTGYDLSRLVTGSFGSLGVIGTVCLKLWPMASVSKTVQVDDGGSAFGCLYRPVAILETDAGVFAYIHGSGETVEGDVAMLGGAAADGFDWPRHDQPPVYAEVRVPARLIDDALARVREIDPLWFVGQHGVGLVEIGLSAYDNAVLEDLRVWAREIGGSVVVTAQGLSSEQRWGPPGDTLGLQRRMKHLFDPSGVLNRGVLPGGV